MVISDDYSYPILIDNIDTPISTQHFWTLDLDVRDFMLSELTMFEEITTPSLALSILGYVIEVPADWNMLVYSPDTSQLDIVEISELTKGGFSALVFDHKKNKIVQNIVTVIDYNTYAVIHTPSLSKTQMLCHALGEHNWVCIAPTDNYNKYLKNALLGDILP